MAFGIAAMWDVPPTVCAEADLVVVESQQAQVVRESVMAASVFEAIGGAPAVAAAVDNFYDRVLGDPSLAPYFVGYDVSSIKGHQRAFLAAALGGPQLYAGRDMAAAHQHLGVSGEAFDRVVVHLVGTLTELNVPADIIGQIGATLAPLKPAIVSA